MGAVVIGTSAVAAGGAAVGASAEVVPCAAAVCLPSAAGVGSDLPAVDGFFAGTMSRQKRTVPSLWPVMIT